MDSIEVWKNSLSDAQSTLAQFCESPQVWQQLGEFTDILVTVFKNENKVFSCGNGGSHCDAMHFAEEWTGRYRKDRKPMAALALGDPSHLSCVSNDFGFEKVFSRQVEALGKSGDALIALSTSGNSQNLIEAVHVCKDLGIKTIGLLGRDGGKLKSLVDLPIVVPAQTSDRIQEVHIKLIHTVIESVERQLFPELY